MSKERQFIIKLVIIAAGLIGLGATGLLPFENTVIQSIGMFFGAWLCYKEFKEG